MTLVQTIMNQIRSDDCDESDRLPEFYEHASEVERCPRRGVHIPVRE